MSKYNGYAARLGEAYKKAREAYLAAVAEMEGAIQMEKSANEWHEEKYIGENDANRAKAKFRKTIAENELNRVTMSAWEEFRTVRDSLTAELKAELRAGATVDPDALDQNGIKLLESGILTAADYSALADKYDDNGTMLKLIASHAKKACETAESFEDRAILFSVIERATGGGTILANWNAINASMDYCGASSDPNRMRNYQHIANMCSQYESLIEPYIENF